jgi:ABC-type lipoprotein export system ATPase subunit
MAAATEISTDDLKVFLQEAEQLLELLDEDLVHLEQESGNEELRQEIFRDEAQWAQLRGSVLPDLIEERCALSSSNADCSTGQEPYSLLMLLDEAGTMERSTVCATDFDNEVLSKARAGGPYTAVEMKGVPQQDLDKHFDDGENGFTANANLRQRRESADATTIGQLYQNLFVAASGANISAASAAYEELIARLGRIVPPEIIEEARTALDLRPFPPDTEAARLSGSELAKLGLLDLVAAQPEVLLLDEPTNHLDLAGIDWLDDYLDGFEVVVGLVSHDRALLDDHVTQLLVLTDRGEHPELFTGDYSSWVKELARREVE